MLAIYLKELRSFFSSMLGYAYIAIFMIVVGFYFFASNLYTGLPYFEYVLGNLVLMFIIIIPVLTMRSIADETNKKTDQLLLTAPVSVEKIVIGKYLGALSVYGITVAITMIYPLVLNGVAQSGSINFARTYYGIFGYFLLGAAYISIGMFISALTESQVMSAVITFVVVLTTYLMMSLSAVMPTDNKTTWLVVAALIAIVAFVLYTQVKDWLVAGIFAGIGEIIALVIYLVRPETYDNLIPTLADAISVVAPFNFFISGVVDASNITYYLSIVLIFVTFTILSIKKKRWS